MLAIRKVRLDNIVRYKFEEGKHHGVELRCKKILMLTKILLEKQPLRDSSFYVNLKKSEQM